MGSNERDIGFVHRDFTDFSYFPLKQKFCRIQSEQVFKMTLLKGCRWFQIFSLIFSYFIF
jgi:hypothetical protein